MNILARFLFLSFLALPAAGCSRRTTSSSSSRPDSTVFRVVPGQRFGVLSDTVSHAQLAGVYGLINVHRTRVQCAEGSCDERGTIVIIPGCPDTLRIFWHDTIALRRPSMVEAAVSFDQYGDSSLHGCWRTAEGMGIGMTLRDLELLNGGPFELEPLGEWDYAGYVGPWLGGRLQNLLHRASGPQIGLRLDFLSSNGLTSSEYDEIAKPKRDSLRSDEPLVRKLNPRVVAFWMTFPAPTECATDSLDFVAGQPSDWLIVPGVRVGPITVNSSEACLQRMLGTDVVTRDSTQWFESENRPATVLFPKDPVRRLTIVWKDDGWSHPIRIELEGATSLWHTADGISLGTPIETLETLNGKPFRITSADHDYGGLIWSWEEGALDAKLKPVELRLENRIYSEEHHPFSNDTTVRATRASVHLIYAYLPE